MKPVFIYLDVSEIGNFVILRKFKNIILFCVIFVIAYVFLPSIAQAETPKTIFYQGRLTNDTGVPLDGNFDLSFELHNDPSASSKVWPSSGDETFNSVDVSRGVYSVYLGSNKALAPADFGETLWLDVKVNGNTFSPRTELSSMPYAFNSYQVQGENLNDLDGRYVDQSGDTMGGNLDMTGDKVLLNGGWLSGNGSNDLTITNQGDVGINTASPIGKTHIIGKNVEPALDTAPLVLEEDGDNDQMFLGGDEIDAPSSDGGLFLQNNNPNDVYMVTGGGSVGIRTNSPIAPLDIGNQGYVAFHNTQDYFLGGGNTPGASASGIHLEAGSNPVDGEPLFLVESSGASERFAVEHRGAIRGDNNLQIDGFPPGPSYVDNESAGFGVGTDSPVEQLDVRGDISVEGTTSTPASSNTQMGFQHIHRGSSGIFFQHPTADITLEFDPATPELIFDNNTGNDWSLGAEVLTEAGNIYGNSDDDFNGTGFTVSMDDNGNQIRVTIVKENSDGPGLVFNGTAENNNVNTIQGFVMYWK